MRFGPTYATFGLAAMFLAWVVICCALHQPERQHAPTIPTLGPPKPLLLDLQMHGESVMRINREYIIFIHTPRGNLTIDARTGAIEYPPTIDLNEAARLFWLAVARNHP